MRTGIRVKLFLSSLALVVLTILVIGLILSHYLTESLTASVEEELIRQNRLAEIVISRTPQALSGGRTDELADALGAASSTRVTILLEDGTVVGDSELTPEEIAHMENHRTREEIRDAVEKGEGKAVRYSATLGQDMMYVAIAFEHASGKGLIRMSKPLSDVGRAVTSLRRVLLFAGFVGLLLSGFMSGVSSFLLSRRLRTLVRFAEQMVTGHHKGPLEVSSRDEIGGLAGTLNKMSKQIEDHMAALAEQRDQFEAVLDGMTEAVIALDGNGYVTLINRAGSMLLGVSGQPAGKMLLEVVRLPALHDIARSLGESREEVSEFELSGDPPRTILAKATSLANGGAVIVLSDISEVRRLEGVRRDFVSNVSHELRTPVSIIQANAETLREGGIDDRDAAFRFLDSLVNNAKRLSNLIADLLDISKIEEGKYALNVEALTVGVALRRAAAALETKAIEREFTIKVEHTGRDRVLADSRALDQVLFNLLDNAVKYTGRGGRVVMRAMTENGAVRIEVEDNGPGIEPRFRERLFERFYRVDKGRSRAMGGTGLGLAIVKHLVMAMGGEVGMSPATPQGSVFWVSLPSADS